MAEHLILSRPENCITVMTVLSHRSSRGQVHITAGGIATLREWDPQFNSSLWTWKSWLGALSLEHIVDPALPFGKLLEVGGKRVPDIVADDLDRAKQVVREAQICVCHVSGSRAMPPRKKGDLVDNRLRVHGTRGLQMVGASVFLPEPSGNTQTTVYSVAERGADIMKEGRQA